jgi:hypothetical protein
VEADVDAAAGGNSVGVLPDRRPVEDVEVRDMRSATVAPSDLASTTVPPGACHARPVTPGVTSRVNRA